ncbi:MAG: Fe(3+) ABC transporter substrate-binding protein [Alphaproteobacteria bacterium]
MTHRSRWTLALLGTVAPLATLPVGAQELNLYSSRHYDTDERLYSQFEEETGITVNRIEGNADELIARIEAEGENSPADVLLTVDAGRLWRADEAGLFQPVDSEMLQERIPAELRHPDGHWFGFSTRARIIFYDKDEIDPELVQTYEDLARSELEDQVCIRSSSNIYNLSLMASLIEHLGAEAAEEWAAGVVENFAREPQGGDTDQIRAVATDACDVSLGNHYYFARLMRSDDPADQEVVEQVGWVFPNQDDRGTHINISGAGVVANAPNRDAAVAFLEYLASDEAQRWLADGNNEYAVVDGVELDNPAHAELGDFEADDLDVSILGENQTQAQILFDRAGWQ